MLRQDSAPPLLDPTNADTSSPLAQSSPAVTVQELYLTSIPTMAEPEAKEWHLVAPEPKKQPEPMKKISAAPPMDLGDPVLKNPVPGSSVLEDPTLKIPDCLAKGSKKKGGRKKTAASEQPA